MAGRGALASALVPALLGLAGCAPQLVPVERAERACMAEARGGQPPRTQVGFGVGSHGVRGGFVQVDLSSDQIAGRDPAEAFSQCVQRRSGEMPRRPLYEQPGWRAS
ncbi:hypothetical protein [Paracoccus sp. (in: a-proteobacteria)]|uniref:hypothetical protein n=1 Tax=Paracoccus sp. TaxID=267 RepID=UPI00321FF4CA